MPVHIESGDRKLLLFAAVVLVLISAAAMVWTPPPEESPFGLPISYSSSSAGAKAAYLLMGELGYDVRRLQEPLTALPSPPGNAVLVLSEPVLALTSGEKQALKNFVAQGGRVLATGSMAARSLPEGAVDSYRSGFEWKRFPALVPSPLTRGAPEIMLTSATSWDARGTGHLGLYGDTRGYVAVTYAVGKGRVVWWASPTPLTNAGIRESGNLIHLLNVLGEPEGTTVIWDEYHHGFRGSFWSYLGRTPVPWATVQILVVFAAIAFTFARRSGPQRAPVVESRLAPLEFVETLGDLYHRAHAAGAALEVAHQRFRTALVRQLGALPSATAPQLARSAAERLGWKEPPILQLLQRCENARRNPNFTDSQALELVQALQDYSERLRSKPRSPQEARK